MQVFKNKTFKRIMSSIVLILMLVGSYRIITENLSNYTYGYNFQQDIKKIKENGEEVDIVFVGASRVYRSMDPAIFEDKLGVKNVLVASTAFQPISGSYYYIKQLIREIEPKKIILDVTWDRMLNEKQTQASLVVYDRLSGFNKLDYALHCFDKSDRRYLLGPCRYRDNLTIYKAVKAEKSNLEKYGYDPENPGADLYKYKGFVDSVGNNTTGSITYNSDDEFSYSNSLIILRNKEYLDKCIEICKESGVDIELVTGPCSVSYMYYVEGYDDAVNWYKEYSEEKNIKYWNLNYLRGREDFLPDECMADYTHTTGEGAEVISNIYADLLLKESMGEDISSYFYENFNEFKKDVHRIVALETRLEFSQTPNEDGSVEANVTLSSLHNDDAKASYKIELMENGIEETSVLSEWSEEENRTIHLPSYGGYQIIVRAKSQFEGDKEAKMVYSY